MLSRKSRSLEHILDNTSSSSSGAGSSYLGLGDPGLVTTLPRLRRCEEVPGMWRAAYTYTDTMRSAKRGAHIARATNIHFLIKRSHMTTHTKVPVLKIVLNRNRESKAVNLVLQEEGPLLFVPKFKTPMRQMKRRLNINSIKTLIIC